MSGTEGTATSSNILNPIANDFFLFTANIDRELTVKLRIKFNHGLLTNALALFFREHYS